MPIDPGLKLTDGSNGEEVKNYRRALGGLLYAALVSRPDVAYAASYLGRFSSKCNEQHWIALQKLVCYLYQTRHYHLEIGPATDELNVYVDASHISEGGHSISGFAIFHGQNLVSWRSLKIGLKMT